MSTNLISHPMPQKTIWDLSTLEIAHAIVYGDIDKNKYLNNPSKLKKYAWKRYSSFINIINYAARVYKNILADYNSFSQDEYFIGEVISSYKQHASTPTDDCLKFISKVRFAISKIGDIQRCMSSRSVDGCDETNLESVIKSINTTFVMQIVKILLLLKSSIELISQIESKYECMLSLMYNTPVGIIDEHVNNLEKLQIIIMEIINFSEYIKYEISNKYT